MNTSILAYENKKPTIKNDHDRILLKLSSNRGYTYNEIAKFLNWSNPNKVSRRLPELLRLKKIQIKEIRKCTIAGSMCKSYVKI